MQQPRTRLGSRELWQRQGNSVQFTFHYSDGPFHNTFIWDPGASQWTFLMESEKKDGTRVVFAEDTVRRR